MNRFVALFLVFSGFCFAHEELSQQIQEISAQIQQSPNDANLYLRRAELNRTDSHWKDAELDYLKAKSLDRELDSVHLGLGLLYYDTQRFADSLKSLNQFLDRHPQHSLALLTRARIFKRDGHSSLAIRDYSKALETQPDPSVYIERADLLTKEKKIPEALAGLNQGIETLGPVVTLELAAIQLDLQLKQYDSALARVDQIAAQAERKEIWLVKRAEILQMASRNKEAKQNYLDALNAIDILPDSRKSTKTTRELKSRIQAALEELSRSPLQ